MHVLAPVVAAIGRGREAPSIQVSAEEPSSFSFAPIRVLATSVQLVSGTVHVTASGEVMEKKGKIPVTGRYCTSRQEPLCRKPLCHPSWSSEAAERRLQGCLQGAGKRKRFSQRIGRTLNLQVLGSGMSGPVQLATSKGQLNLTLVELSIRGASILSDGEKCAVKSFKKHGLSETRRTDLKNEAPRRLFYQIRNLPRHKSRSHVLSRRMCFRSTSAPLLLDREARSTDTQTQTLCPPNPSVSSTFLTKASGAQRASLRVRPGRPCWRLASLDQQVSEFSWPLPALEAWHLQCSEIAISTSSLRVMF